ncbi:MAG: M48 family metallopeptidase [bacterium]
MISIILWIILAILLFEFILERLLDYLNSTWWSDRLPEELVGIYDEEKYFKSQNYIRHRQKFSTLVSTLSFFGIFIILSMGGFAYLDNQILRLTINPIVRALLFFGVIGAIASVLSIPFDAYSTFVIEAKYGFNTTTVRTFLMDILKGWLLALVIGGGMMSLIIWIYETTGNYFWLIAWGVITFFSIFFTLFYSNLIVPLFNKQSLLEEGDLKDAIKAFALSTGFKMKDIYIIDGSKRSKKVNAYFTGFGKKRRIVLYDTLIQNHTVDELVAVLAHEIGHNKKRHTLEGLILSIIQSGIMLFILSLFIQKNSHLADALCQALGGFAGIGVHQSFHMGVLGFGILYSPISMMMGILMNMRSRKNEFDADRFASLNFNPGALQSALKKLSVDNLSNLRPHPLCVFFNYSHPPLLQRLNAIRDLSST